MPEKLRPVALALIAVLAVVMCAAALWGTSSSAQQTDLERRLESILSCVQGAGNVRVLVHGAQSESVFAFAGLEESAQDIVGVIIVAQGADNAAVAARLAQAAGAALGVDQSCIEVYTMEPGK